jgi:hypothetical protein
MALQQTSGGKDEPNIGVIQKSDNITLNSERNNVNTYNRTTHQFKEMSNIMTKMVS